MFMFVSEDDENLIWYGSQTWDTTTNQKHKIVPTSHYTTNIFEISIMIMVGDIHYLYK